MRPQSSLQRPGRAGLLERSLPPPVDNLIDIHLIDIHDDKKHGAYLVTMHTLGRLAGDMHRTYGKLLL
jgi:hypothetical protein